MPSVDTKNTVYTYFTPRNVTASHKQARKTRQEAAKAAGFTRSKQVPELPTRPAPAAPVALTPVDPTPTKTSVTTAAPSEAKPSVLAQVKSFVQSLPALVSGFYAQAKAAVIAAFRRARAAVGPTDPTCAALNDLAKVETALNTSANSVRTGKLLQKPVRVGWAVTAPQPELVKPEPVVFAKSFADVVKGSSL